MYISIQLLAILVNINATLIKFFYDFLEYYRNTLTLSK